VSVDRAYELTEVRADGWFERVVAGVPALERLCDAVGVPLVALALVAGFRITTASIDKLSNEVESLAWIREQPDGTEREVNGTPAALRAEVLAALVGDADPAFSALPSGSVADLRACIGARYLMLAPLFGLNLRTLLASDTEEPRLVVAHQQIEEIVPLRMLRRFLRSRVIDALQSERSRAVSIDLEQAQVARKAFEQGRYDDVLARLSGWVQPLLVYLRTPEGSALEPRVRAEIATALSVLGESFSKLGRKEESEEALRLGVQYAQEGPLAGDVYRTLARVMMTEQRWAEAIGPLRRAITLEPERHGVLADLGRCFLRSGRAVAALGCVQQARGRGESGEALRALEGEVREALGETIAAYETVVAPRGAGG